MEKTLQLESVSYRRKLRQGYRKVMPITKQELTLKEEKIILK